MMLVLSINVSVQITSDGLALKLRCSVTPCCTCMLLWDHVTVLYSLLYRVFGTLLFWLLFLYLSYIFPGEFGVRKPFHFPITGKK